MDKKSIPIIILCLLVFLFAQPITEKLGVPPPSRPTAPTNKVSSAQGGPVHSATNTTTQPKIQNSILGHLPTNAAPFTVAHLQNEVVDVEISAVGGGIGRVTLKQFPSDPDPKKASGPIVLNDGSPVPILALATPGVDMGATYEVISSSGNLEKQVVMTHLSSSGLLISKTIELKEDYVLDATITVKNTTAAAMANLPLQLALGMAAPMTPFDGPDYVGLTVLAGDKAVPETLAGIAKYVSKQNRPWEKQDSPLIWASLKNQYFTILATPEHPFSGIEAQAHALPQSSQLHAKQHPQGLLASVQSEKLNLAPGESAIVKLSLYTGPKELKRLTALGAHQDRVLDFSWFETISKFLLWLMTWLHSMVGNWGVAIILVTVIIKIVFWPLTAISTKSMKQMQALAPKMNELKEKYKDDSKKLNEEMMKMYRDYRINPMAGCLPMIVQIPIFIAFYNMLRVAIELRGAHFLWIQDLSAADTVGYILGYPINVLPLVMAVTMIWQTKITPQAPNTDPAMKMMMWFMPITFLFICYSFSSGLSLYWTAQNLLTILQTYLTRDKPVEPPQKIKPSKGGGFTFARPIDKR